MSRARAALAALVVAATLPVVAIYVVKASALVAYPWDWSPDEGVPLDCARRLLQSPASLYPRQYGPFPDVYGPVLPGLLAPVVASSDTPLPLARALALAWTAALAVALYLLLARRLPRWLRSQRFSSAFHTTKGKSITQQNARVSASGRPRRWPRLSRSRPRLSNTAPGWSATKSS